jgi:peroxiredoxin
MRHPFVALALSAVLAVPAIPAAADVAIGDKLPGFTLSDAVDGKLVDVKAVLGKKATVLLFIATQCPVSNAYNERMAALARDYAGKDVTFIGINSNKQEASPEIAAHAKAHGFTFPVLKDVDNVQADAFGARVTPEVYVYDSKAVLRYHGRIDDDKSGSNIQSQDLRVTLDALIAGKDVPVTVTKAFGCSIKRVVKAEAKW